MTSLITLDDMAFRRLYPKEYGKIALKVVDSRYKREQLVNQYINQLRSSLKKEGIPADISGRPKDFYSTFRKMLRKNHPVEKIHDLLGVRLITSTLRNCYFILEIAQSLWKPLKGLHRDYIKKPKVNGYRSLHNTVQDEIGVAFEIQIRTREMHLCAEMGIAAHSIYKNSLLT
jgi:GTP diphosphokinase / guanosine-3',5'-bis(diphosphate) 3'-diphosphatase